MLVSSGILDCGAGVTVSLANPWLDFMPGTEETLDLTKRLNDDLQETCLLHPSKLWAFGVLHSAASPVSAWLDTLHHISSLPRVRGVILGTKGLGNGLDDPALDPIWEQLEKSKLMIFIHPHYGIPKDLYGPQENGHVLPLALGFPFETTIVPLLLLYIDLNGAGYFPTYPRGDVR